MSRTIDEQEGALTLSSKFLKLSPHVEQNFTYLVRGSVHNDLNIVTWDSEAKRQLNRIFSILFGWFKVAK